MSNKLERNKFLAEKLGSCWHEWVEQWHDACADYTEWICSKCNEVYLLPDLSVRQGEKPYQIDFYNWNGFGLLLTHAKSQPDWLEFLVYMNICSGYCMDIEFVRRFGCSFPLEMLDVECFVNIRYEYLKKR